MDDSGFLIISYDACKEITGLNLHLSKMLFQWHTDDIARFTHEYPCSRLIALYFDSTKALFTRRWCDIYGWPVPGGQEGRAAGVGLVRTTHWKTITE